MMLKKGSDGEYYIFRKRVTRKATPTNIFFLTAKIRLTGMSIPKELQGKKAVFKLEVIEDGGNTKNKDRNKKRY